jgi:hypothetical protein
MAVFGLEFPPQPLDRFLQKLGSNCFHLIKLMADWKQKSHKFDGVLAEVGKVQS